MNTPRLAGSLDRRGFIQSAAAAGVGVGVSLTAGSAARAGPAPARLSPHNTAAPLRVGVIGCGGRGTGAAINILEASPDTQVVALADVFKERIDGCRAQLAGDEELAPRARIADDRCYTGFDAASRLIAESGVDIVILATPPGFRPRQFEAAVNAGKHVFMEKPVAVDPAGIRIVLDAARKAEEKNLSVVAGTQRRHERSYREAMTRLRDGAIGRIVAARCFWNQGGLWMHRRKPEWSDVEWQLRNWLYFTWLSGDHIVEQHVHNLDAVNWAIGASPIRCTAMGGRQVRTDPAYGHIFDHFAVLFEYPGEVFVTSMCRQIEGCSGQVEEGFTGTDGTCTTSPGRAEIRGKAPWKFSGDNPNPYVEEHKALLAGITGGTPINEARQVAESTLAAIMGRMSAYTGKSVTWDQALNSKLDLWPGTLELGSMAVPEVAVPGKSPLVLHAPLLESPAGGGFQWT